jgi:hypothetical protein
LPLPAGTLIDVSKALRRRPPGGRVRA